jgi:hypothetical protein
MLTATTAGDYGIAQHRHLGRPVRAQVVDDTGSRNLESQPCNIRLGSLVF